MIRLIGRKSVTQMLTYYFTYNNQLQKAGRSSTFLATRKYFINIYLMSYNYYCSISVKIDQKQAVFNGGFSVQKSLYFLFQKTPKSLDPLNIHYVLMVQHSEKSTEIYSISVTLKAVQILQQDLIVSSKCQKERKVPNN